jgi:hypothetical protein
MNNALRLAHLLRDNGGNWGDWKSADIYELCNAIIDENTPIKKKIVVRTFKDGRTYGEQVYVGEFELDVIEKVSPNHGGCFSSHIADGQGKRLWARVGDRLWLVSDGAIYIRQDYTNLLEPEYITPTDEDAKSRPEVEILPASQVWRPATLLACIDGTFVVRRTGSGGMIRAYDKCRMRNPRKDAK